MLEILNNFFMNLTIIIGLFLMTRYVFLEQGMEEKKQRIYYLVSIVLMFALSFAFGSEYNLSGMAILLGGLNNLLGRKKYRLLGFLLVVPLVGLMNGVAGPIFISQQLFDGSPYAEYYYLGVYILIMVLLVVFYFAGKEWRRWFAENMKNRRPQPGEYLVVCLSGIILLFTHGAIYTRGDLTAYDPDARKVIVHLIMYYHLIAFLLTITIIVLIMQGNRRKFYHDRVSNMQFHMIATMADIVENRDSNTGGHIHRTAKYVEIIGRNLKKKNEFSGVLTDQYLEDMIVAAPLHDIGKISIPDAILNKPGRLTDEEFAIMKTHAAAGREALQKAESKLGEFNYLKVAQDMAEYHHEWWNGKGYPNGISGEDIPLCARIMAVADVFDALTSKRCYKDAMPLEKAYSIIREESGTHFDPQVAETFLQAHQEIEEAMKELAENS